MPANKLHADEVDTDASLVARLLAVQFPQWATLRIEPITASGTDNAMYRLGEDLVARLPRIRSAARKVEKEQRWLPRLAPLLPLAIPVPRALGAPGEGYPWRWSIYSWLEGEAATVDGFTDPSRVAVELAQFISALERIDPAGGPLAGRENGYRGAPLAIRDAHTRAAIDACRDMLDADLALVVWEGVLELPEWRGPPVWVHGDLQPGNLLSLQGQLAAVIDFGCLGVGDPACDLMVAWNLLSAKDRKVFRAALSVDEATWARGRGWALSTGLIALPYYQNSNPVFAADARHRIVEALSDLDAV